MKSVKNFLSNPWVIGGVLLAVAGIIVYLMWPDASNPGQTNLDTLMGTGANQVSVNPNNPPVAIPTGNSNTGAGSTAANNLITGINQVSSTQVTPVSQ